MRVGDILELLCATALTVAGYLASSRVWVALAVLGICLFYLAQNYASTPLRRKRKPEAPARRHS